MRILTEYLGATWPQQFQGFNSLGYQFSAVGIGDTERFALENAIDTLALLIPGGMPYEVEKAIRDDYGPADDTITALEAVDAGPDEGPKPPKAVDAGPDEGPKPPKAVDADKGLYLRLTEIVDNSPYHYVGVAYDPE